MTRRTKRIASVALTTILIGGGVASAFVRQDLAQTPKAKSIAECLGLSEDAVNAAFGAPVALKHLKGGVRADGGPRDDIHRADYAPPHGSMHFQVWFKNGAFDGFSYPPTLDKGFAKGAWKHALEEIGLPTAGTSLVGEKILGTKYPMRWEPTKVEPTYGLYFRLKPSPL